MKEWMKSRPPVAPSDSEIVFSWDKSLGLHINSKGQTISQGYPEIDEMLCSQAWRNIADILQKGS